MPYVYLPQHSTYCISRYGLYDYHISWRLCQMIATSMYEGYQTMRHNPRLWNVCVYVHPVWTGNLHYNRLLSPDGHWIFMYVVNCTKTWPRWKMGWETQWWQLTRKKRGHTQNQEWCGGQWDTEGYALTAFNGPLDPTSHPVDIENIGMVSHSNVKTLL